MKINNITVRRFEKKVTVAGTTTLHQRYIYRGFLQIAALDLLNANLVAAHYILWDPTQPTATRPLAIQTAGTWFVYGHDLTKNVMELFGPNGFIRNEYSYAPFGAVSATTDLAQPFQFSSEFYDSELALVYYNYRHYSPDLGRFLSRDPIEEQGGLNLYVFVKNKVINIFDLLGTLEIILNETVKEVSPFGLPILKGEVEFSTLKEKFEFEYIQNKNCCYSITAILRNVIEVNMWYYDTPGAKEHEYKHLELISTGMKFFESSFDRKLLFESIDCIKNYLSILLDVHCYKITISNLEFDISEYSEDLKNPLIKKKENFQSLLNASLMELEKTIEKCKCKK